MTYPLYRMVELLRFFVPLYVKFWLRLTSVCTVCGIYHKMWVLQVYMASSSHTETVVGPSWCAKLFFYDAIYACYLRLMVCVAFQSNSWASFWATRSLYPTDKPPTGLFCSYFYSHFHPHTSYNFTGCAIYSTRERFCFTMSRIGSYMLFIVLSLQ